MGHAILLLACILDRSLDDGLPNFPDKLRTIRNVLEDSDTRASNMPAIVVAFQRYLAGGMLDANRVLSKGQIDEENQKTTWLMAHPEMRLSVHQLEDHPLLHGNLAGFDLDKDRLAARADAFRRIMAARDQWLDLTAAFLTTGDYQRTRVNGWAFQFGSTKSDFDLPWHEVFTARSPEMEQRREVFNRFLDRVAASDGPLAATYAEMTTEFLGNRESDGRFDWRYYMVKYPQMRSIDGDGGGLYFTNRDTKAPMGYLLATTRRNKTQVNSKYRDPYLFTILDRLTEPDRGKLSARSWYTGYETRERWLGAMDDGIAFRCDAQGFIVRPSSDLNGEDAYRAIRNSFGINDDGLLRVPQSEIDGAMVDTKDRIFTGTHLLEAIIASGF